MVMVSDQQGVKRQYRCILDSGSQINFVSKKIAYLAKLPRNKTSVPISGIGASHTRSSTSVTLKIESQVKVFGVELTCHVLPTIVEDLPACSSTIRGWQVRDELLSLLADPSFELSGPIDLLIFGGTFFDLL